MRFLGVMFADEYSERGEVADPSIFSRMGAFMEEVSKAGVLVDSNGLQPTSKGKRIKLENGTTSVIDGPFTESKELIASYAIFETPSIDEAVYWTQRFLEVLGGGTCEIRPISTFDDFPPEYQTSEAVAQEKVWRENMEKLNQ